MAALRPPPKPPHSVQEDAATHEQARSDAVTYHGDDLDRYLSEFDGCLEGMDVSPEIRLDLGDRARIFALTRDNDPRAGPDTLSFLLDVGEITEAYERRTGNHAAADHIARFTTGLTLFAELPEDLRNLAGHLRGDPPPFNSSKAPP